MNRCQTCLMPNTRPDTPFEDGICGACHSAAKRPHVDWDARRKELVDLLDRHNGRCIVPSSGGKDSHFQVLTLLEMGADVTVVTATTCHPTELGRKNIANLARYARTVEYTPNQTVRAKLNRLGLELVGDISWPEHVSIFTTPFRAATQLGIPLIFYGENPQNHYGGPLGTEEAKTMTRRWVSEFGGFLGLRPADMVGQMGITEADMRDYMPPGEWSVVTTGIGAGRPGMEAHFIGQYIPWDSRSNGLYAMQYGMQVESPTPANWLQAENLDNAQTGLHDYFGFLKYGYGRGCAQISMDIRAGRISREEAIYWLIEHDGLFPFEYAGVKIDEVLGRLGFETEAGWNWLLSKVREFANPELFHIPTEGDELPRLKEL